MTEVTVKEHELNLTLSCDMSTTENAVDIMFGVLVMLGHHPENIAYYMKQKSITYESTTDRSN